MRFRELFRAGEIPVYQNRTFDSEQSALSCETGAVILAQDMDTGLVCNVAFDANIMDYDLHYQNEQACSGVFRRHLEDVTHVIDRHFRGKPLVEVGCGKGFFLNTLRTLGYNATGIDPAYQGNSPYVVKARFQESLGLRADGVVLRHVLEHIPDPVDFLGEIARANGGRGLVYIEVPCFEWICRNRAWFDVFYEHVNYFTLDDFVAMFETIHESGHLFDGQYLYVVADLGSLRTPRFVASKDFPSNFLPGPDHFISLSDPLKRRAVWGAAAKGMMFALQMTRSGLDVEFAIDINPAKQGTYLAGSGLRVLSPSGALKVLQRGDEIWVTNSNYIDEIEALSQNRFHYILGDHL
jgi:hypothetical protein